MVGFLRALALQIEELDYRVEQVVDLISYWSECYRRLPWFVVVINHPGVVGQGSKPLHKQRPTLTVVSCHNAAYFEMNYTPSLYSRIYYVSDDIEEMTIDQALERALHNRKIISSIPSYKKLAPYAI